MSGKKYFILQNSMEDTSQVFASKQPRGAALKAAGRGETDIRLRERGTNRVHIFEGWRAQVPKPASGPAWLPDKIWKANVKKLRVEHLDDSRYSKTKKTKRTKRPVGGRGNNDGHDDDFNKGDPDFYKGDSSNDLRNRISTHSGGKKRGMDVLLEKMSKTELIDMIHRLTEEED
jgi:hypothetical protein